jgi:hypothetical protein
VQQNSIGAAIVRSRRARCLPAKCRATTERPSLKCCRFHNIDILDIDIGWDNQSFRVFTSKVLGKPVLVLLNVDRRK